MAIPDFQSLMLPLLSAVADGAEHRDRDLAILIAKQHGLSDQELAQMMPSGQASVFRKRLAWAKAHLKWARLVESPLRGTTRITEEGREVLARPPQRIDVRFLKQFPAYNWRGKPTCLLPPDETAPTQETGRAPEEVLESSYQSLREQVAGELLEKLKTCSPAFFESVVVRLLEKMGYGGSVAAAGEVTGKSGDGGIDGIIRGDTLGLEELCIQAKRWPENTVGRPVVQAFAGSMEGRRAKKGVLFTTSSFSRDAEEYVTKIERKIALIGGERLAELMIDHGIGVTTARTFNIWKVDTDYFSEEDAY